MAEVDCPTRMPAPSTPQTASSPGEAVTPRAVRAWFDTTYATRGLRYLRPPEAYPIYLQLLAAQPGERLLDVGCGPGLLLEAAARRGLRTTGVDLALVGLQMAQRRAADADLALGSAEQLPFADASFDLATCIGVLERVFDRPRAVAEFARVLRPGGRLCCMVRNAHSLSWRVRRVLGRQDHRSHQDAATLEQWSALFSAAGFAVDAVHIDQWWRQKLRRLWRGRPDFTRDEPIARPILPVQLALEFIFLLRKEAP